MKSIRTYFNIFILVSMLFILGIGRDEPKRILTTLPGTQPGQVSLNQLQRRILVIWADDMREINPSDSLAREIDAVLREPDSDRPLTMADRDVLEACAIGEGPRGRALRRALEVHDKQNPPVLPSKDQE